MIMNNSYWALSVEVEVLDHELKTWFKEDLILAVFREKPSVEDLSRVFFNTKTKDEKVKAKDIADIGILLNTGNVKSTIGREIHREKEQNYLLRINKFD